MSEWTLIATILMMANLQATGTRSMYGESWAPKGPTEIKIEREYQTEAECRRALDNLSKSYAPLSAKAMRMGDHPYFNWRTGEPAHAWSDGRTWLNMDSRPNGSPGTWLSPDIARKAFADRWRISLDEADKIQKRIERSADKNAEFDRVYDEMTERWLKEATTKMFGGGQCVQI